MAVAETVKNPTDKSLRIEKLLWSKKMPDSSSNFATFAPPESICFHACHFGDGAKFSDDQLCIESALAQKSGSPRGNGNDLTQHHSARASHASPAPTTAASCT
jgi:hypothetical protein